MTINVDEFTRIISNPCDGYDVQICAKDKKTGEPATDKRGDKCWRFYAYHPTLDACRKDLLQRMVAPADLDTYEKIVAALNEALRVLTAYDAGITPGQWAHGRAEE